MRTNDDRSVDVMVPVNGEYYGYVLIDVDGVQTVLSPEGAALLSNGLVRAVRAIEAMKARG